MGADGFLRGTLLKKKDWIIVGAALTAAALLYLITALPGVPGAYAIVRVNGEVYQSVPLGEPARIVVDQGDGRVNVVIVDEEGVHMESSSCQNQLCVRQGTLVSGEMDEWTLGRWIVCLPNGVTVELAKDAP